MKTTVSQIDVDIEPQGRAIAKQWFYDHPKLNACEILALVSEQEKGAIDTSCRALNISLQDAKTIKDNITESRKKEEYCKLFKMVDSINGYIKTISSHPAGVLVTDKTIDIASEIGIITIKEKDENGNEKIREICQFNMKELEDLGYVKADALGLANVGVINRVYSMLNKKRPTPQEINFNDESVWEEIKKSPVGIFQFEAEESHRQLCLALENAHGADKIQTTAMTSGIIRPSGESIRANYLKGVPYDNGHEAINELFKDNLGYCIEENTTISTSEGYKKIKDIKVGDMVNTLDGYKKVNMVFNNGIKDCYKITTKRGYNLICTKEHKIMTQSGYKKLKDLDLNYDSIVMSLNDCTNDEKISIRYARILGMLCGDGMLTQRRLVKFISNNKKQAEDFRNLIKEEFNDCDVTIRKDTYDNRNDLFICNVINKVKFSKNIKSIMKELIIDGYKSLDGGCGASDKFIPKRVMDSSKKIKLGFLSGLLDTDGCITARGHIRFKTSSCKLANDIQDMLRSIGYMSNIYQSNDKAYDITVRNGHCLHLELIGMSNKANDIKYTQKKYRGVKIVSSNFLKDNLSKRYSKIKYPDISKNFLTSMFTPKNEVSLDKLVGLSIQNELKDETIYLLNKDCCFDRIDKITHIGLKNVYDMEVNENHSYFANGVVVHNCIYQEDIMSFLKEFCGYNDHEADTVRRCVHSDTMVTLTSGKRVKIKDINVGDEVLCVDKNMKIKSSRVTNKWNNGIRKMMKIKTSYGNEIICTPDHEVLSNGKWVKAENLNIGDCLYTNKTNSDLMHVTIESIEFFGEDECYDIEVEKYHNFIGNNIVVHNCIAKKVGTESLIPEIENRFIEYFSEKYDVSKERCQELIKGFLKIVEDASSYGLNTRTAHVKFL